MKQVLIYVAFLGFFLISSCSEDFQLTEKWKDIPVIYGLINRNDSIAQYIRVEKAFVDENIAASKIAQIADSLYYKDAVVTLVNISKKKTYTLTKVDASLDGIFRKDGPFATLPNYMYKINTADIDLTGGDTIQLQVDRGDGKAIVQSTIVNVSDILFTLPDVGINEFKIFPNNSTVFKWRHNSNTRVFNLIAFIHIIETKISTQEVDTVVIKLPYVQNMIGTNTGRTQEFTQLRINFSAVYSALHDNLKEDPDIQREFLNIRFDLTGGGPQILEYLEILNINTGITASQEIPRYTNISEGFGLFSSATRISKTIAPDNRPPGPNTIDSLQSSPLTKNLNFRL